MCGCMEFEKLLSQHRSAVERFVRYRIRMSADAEDVLQETYIAAFEQFGGLQNRDFFKTWLLAIARHKCADYYRKAAKRMEFGLTAAWDLKLAAGARKAPSMPLVGEALEKLGEKERRILYLYYDLELPVEEIAEVLQIPPGTVKSRLYTARQRFRSIYQGTIRSVCPDAGPKERRENMKKLLPDLLPDYTIVRSEEEPFSVRHEELPGMFIIPALGNRLTVGMYNLPERKWTGTYELTVRGKIEIHEQEGVEIESRYRDADGSSEAGSIFAQLSDSYCRYLGGESTGKDGRRIITFLDGEAFERAYAIGDNNCGFEVDRRPRGRISEEASSLLIVAEEEVSDIVGRFEVTIAGKKYDTVRLIDIEASNGGKMLCEYYLDSAGRTVLWRRFNSDNWANSRYGAKWSKLLPDNDRLTVNGENYVHWYDCITDYIL